MRPPLVAALATLLLLCPLARARELPAGVAWIHELKHPLNANLAAVGDRVIALSGTHLTGLRASDGKTMWSVPDIYANFLRVHDGLIVVQHAWEVTVFDPEDGRQLWRERYDRSSWRYASGRIWHLRKGELLARDLRTGQVRWHRALPKVYKFWVDGRGVLWSDDNRLHWLGFQGESWSLDRQPREMLRTSLGWLADLDSGACLISPQGKIVWSHESATRPVLIGDVVCAYALQGFQLATGRKLWKREHYYNYGKLGPWLILEKRGQLVFIDPKTGATKRRIFGSRYMKAVAANGYVDILTTPGRLSRYRSSDLGLLREWPRLLTDFAHEFQMIEGSAAGGRSFHGLHASVAALGAGPGHVLYDGPAEVSLNLKGSRRNPLRVVVFGRNLRKVEVEVWTGGSLVGRQVVPLPAGADKAVTEANFQLPQPGVYQVVARGRGAVVRETLDLP